MAKFTAEAPDMTLELTTLTGEERILVPKDVISGTKAKEIMKLWTDLEAKVEKDKISPIELLSKELSFVYEIEPDWFEENFDVATLQTIMTHVARMVGGAKKK